MAILEEKVLIRLDNKVIKHYEGLGYEIPRRRDSQGRLRMPRGAEILVKVSDLTNGSNVKVTKVCDDCGDTVKLPYSNIINSRNNKFKDGMDRCFKCARIKMGDLLVKSYTNTENCIANVDKEFAKIFWDKEDTFKYTCKSSRKANFKCPRCLMKIEDKKISDTYRQGLSCPRCSDGVSYPEKFVWNMLNQIGVKFETQMIFDWAKDKKYDVYIESKNCVMEIHGVQHYQDRFNMGRTVEEEQENDKEKKRLAKDNGLDYIEIDARISEFDHMKMSINSKLSNTFDLSVVNWGECQKYACNSLIVECWRYWDNGVKNTREIANILNLNYNTVSRYLKKGSDAGLCSYTVREAQIMAGKRRIGQKSVPVIQLSLKGDFIARHDSISSAVTKLQINVKNAGSNITATCKGRQKSAYGYKWIYEE